MRADKFGTPKEQLLWNIGFLSPGERKKPITTGCEQCFAVAIVRQPPDMTRQRMTCNFFGGQPFQTNATAICNNWKER